jgi:hypothetical protein
MIRRLLYVALFLEVGLMLIVLPWSAFWDHNYFVNLWTPLRPVLTSYFCRGAVSGLGFVNLYAGVADLVVLVVARERRDVQ